MTDKDPATSSQKATHYPSVEPKPNIPALEDKILQFWKDNNIFEKSVEQRNSGKEGANEYVFYDGPPFANGLPHYGHLLTGYVKDVLPRYQTLKGHRVERRFGWDCHGLPAELEAEKELGISGRAQILDYGIEKFNSACQSSVLRYTDDWEFYVNRQARWVDFRNSYKTMDLSYMESVMWAFKQLWEKGLIYEGYRVMPYSWAIESPLSNFETRLDNSYRKRQDPSITFTLELTKILGEELPLKLLVWSTTPWTVPSNLAAAVGSDINYAIFEESGTRYVLCEEAIERYSETLAQARRIGSIKGKELLGRHYKPVFPYFANTPDAFRVLHGDFVETSEGTGIVQQAPGFGEDDQLLCEQHGIPIVCPIDSRGRFTSEVSDYQGQNVLEANKMIIRDLKKLGVLVRHETYEHNYPHCWRTDEPLIYKAVSSWYVRVTAFRDLMVELNQQISWVPEHIRDGLFGNWLAGARDWSISRSRFWGSPLPVWKSDDPKYPRVDVYGSLSELERDFGRRPENLHRPHIDNFVRPNPDDPSGKSQMRRVEDVLDCWFESGSMPFAQVHYPFENKEWFESHFPADFIVEYIAQTRGWFYTLMVMATALFEKPPFRNCICHGVVLDENRQKLSKRLRNYPTTTEVFKQYGADALRWFLISSSILRGEDLLIDREGKAIGEVIRRIITPLWSAYYFFCLYANADGIKAELSCSSNNLLDRYVLSKTHELIQSVETSMDAYDIPRACFHIQNFLDVLNNWYIRRSRERFWSSESSSDKQTAYNTLYTVLHTLYRVASPMLPLITEEVYKGLASEESVHLSDWPATSFYPFDRELVVGMDKVRAVCSAALAVRQANNLRVRLPLHSLTYAAFQPDVISPYLHLVKDEVNVKDVRLENDYRQFCELEVKINPSAAIKLGTKMQEVIDACNKGNFELKLDGNLEVSGYHLVAGEYGLRLKPRAGFAGQALPSNDGVVLLDIEVSSELMQEGTVRDVIRIIQQTRKEASLDVADRISLTVAAPDRTAQSLKKFTDYVCEQTLALDLKFRLPADGMYVKQATLDGEDITIGLQRTNYRQ